MQNIQTRCIIIFLIVIIFPSIFFPVTLQGLEQNGEEKKESALSVSFGKTNISFNPLHSYTATEAQIYSAIFEGLVSYHPLTMEPVPGAAYTWKISEDKKIYSFFLRENGKYWNGDPVTAYDFRNTWLKLLAPEEESEYSFLFDVIKNARAYRTGKLEQTDTVGIHAAGPYRLDIELEHPADHFLKVLCHHSFVPVHPQFLQKDHWNSTNIIPGNGPFYVYSQDENQIVLLKNNLYWDEKRVYYDKINILMQNDAAKNTEQFNSGSIQWMTDGILVDQIKNKETIITNPLFATNYFYFNCAEPPWNNHNIRRGLALLLPWDLIRSNRFLYIPTDRLIPQLPHYPVNEGISETDIDAGLRLLAEAGYPEGKDLPPIIIKIPGSFESRRISLLMQKAWTEQLSVEVTIDEYTYDTYYNELKEGNFTLGTISWIGDFPDPLTFLQMWTTDSNLNDAGYSGELFDSIIDRSMTQTGKQRYSTLSEAETILLHDAVVLPINHLPAWNIIDLFEINGWYTNPLDIHPFKYIRKHSLQVDPWIVKAVPAF